MPVNAMVSDGAWPFFSGPLGISPGAGPDEAYVDHNRVNPWISPTPNDWSEGWLAPILLVPCVSRARSDRVTGSVSVLRFPILQHLHHEE